MSMTKYIIWSATPARSDRISEASRLYSLSSVSLHVYSSSSELSKRGILFVYLARVPGSSCHFNCDPH